MSTKVKSVHSSQLLALYDKLIETCDGVERKGVTMPYTSFNGHMFSYLDNDGNLNLRLPSDALEVFKTKYKTANTVANGIMQKEYTSVPSALFKKTKELQPHFKISLAYVKSLKQKPTTRKATPLKK